MTEQINPSARKIVDLDRQSIVLDGEERIHVSTLCDYGNKDYTISKLYDDVSTLYEGFLRGERVSNDGSCLGWRPDGNSPYEWMTYSQVRKKAHFFGSALVQKGFAPSNDTTIGIFSQNRTEWVISDLGCMTFSMVTAPLYSTLGPKGYEYIINLTSMKLIVVDDLEKASNLLSQIEKMPTLTHIVIMDSPISDQVKGQAKEANIEVITFEEMLTLGETNLQDPKPCKPDDMAVIRFTSGTTGVPKGAMTTHRNLVANVAAIYSLINRVHACEPGSVSISYLPLAHTYEHTLEAMLFLHGCSIGFFRGDVKTLVQDMQVLKPDVFPSVPRLANRLYDKIMGGVNSASFIKRSLFNLAYWLKSGDSQKGILRTDTWSDYLVFNKVQALLGGKVKWMITGSAPIAPEVLEFFRIVLGVQISEAYGQTETAAATSCTVPGETQAGHVGPPLPCNMMKVVDIPEMGYFASEGKGEVCIKGENIFKGYYKNQEKTDETLDADGWLHSGDVGQWLPNGTLKIIDRKKHIYKLAQGEYVAPEKIETVLSRSNLIAQAFVYGESLKASNVAIIVPDEEELQRIAKGKNINESMQDLCKNETIREAIKTELANVSKAGNLCGFEKVWDFSLQPEQFSIENGLLTPTMKNKRVTIKERFQPEIDDMYSRLQ